jgi:hypothetical protein
MAAAKAVVSFGSTKQAVPFLPATSGKDEAVLVITGVPQAIASSTGKPNPSK